MADENRNTESFVLGLIVAALLFLLLRREFLRLASGEGAGDGAGSGRGSAPNCGCGGNPDDLPSNPALSIGGQSYNSGAPFGSSSVVSIMAGR